MQDNIDCFPRHQIALCQLFPYPVSKSSRQRKYQRNSEGVPPLKMTIFVGRYTLRATSWLLDMSSTVKNKDTHPITSIFSYMLSAVA